MERENREEEMQDRGEVIEDRGSVYIHITVMMVIRIMMAPTTITAGEEKKDRKQLKQTTHSNETREKRRRG